MPASRFHRIQVRFVVSNSGMSLADLEATIDGQAESSLELGDCPDFTVCVATNGSQPPIPGGPYGSC